MSNFFAALDDSGDDAAIPKQPVPKLNANKVSKGATIAEASKPERRSRQRHDDRNTKSGRGRPDVRDGKRQYDRRSGTGRGREIKKGGGGGRNWGSERDQMKRGGDRVGGYNDKPDENNNDADDEKESEEKVNDDDAVETEERPKKVEEEVIEEEEEDKTISYEEYVRQKNESVASELLAPIVSTKELENEFAGVKVSVQKEAETFTAGREKQFRKKGANSNKKVTKEITPAFRVGERVGGGDGGGRGGRGGRGGDRREGGGRGDRREGGGRGDRRDRGGPEGGYRGRGGGGRGNDRREGGRDGGYRGRGGGGGGRGGRSKPTDFSVTDEAFPSLG